MVRLVGVTIEGGKVCVCARSGNNDNKTSRKSNEHKPALVCQHRQKPRDSCYRPETVTLCMYVSVCVVDLVAVATAAVLATSTSLNITLSDNGSKLLKRERERKRQRERECSSRRKSTLHPPIKKRETFSLSTRAPARLVWL